MKRFIKTFLYLSPRSSLINLMKISDEIDSSPNSLLRYHIIALWEPGLKQTRIALELFCLLSQI